jgi:dihydroorotate dehydrogenase (NAD+) catalytic subunit
MAVDLCGLELAHPVINGSGTFDVIAARRVFGPSIDENLPFSAFVSKTITLEPRLGNPPPRLFETAAGMINSIGLPNRGLAGYLEHDLPQLATLPVPLITNVMGSNADEVGQLLEALDGREEVAALELNVSCPNVKTGLDIGSDPAELTKLLAAVRGKTSKPLIVKLTPNTANVALVAEVKQALKRLAVVELRYVPGHSGVPLNERADALATEAVRRRATRAWTTVSD